MEKLETPPVSTVLIISKRLKGFRDSLPMPLKGMIFIVSVYVCLVIFMNHDVSASMESSIGGSKVTVLCCDEIWLIEEMIL